MNDKPTLDYQPARSDATDRGMERRMSIFFGSIVCFFGLIPLWFSAYSTYRIVFYMRWRYFREDLAYTILWWVLAISVGYLGVRLIRYGIKLGRSGGK
jgi:hypothetical protein